MTKQIVTATTFNADMVPSFDKAFTSLLAAQQGFDTASMTFAESRNAIFQHHADACTVAAIPRTKEGFNAIVASMLDNQMVIDAIAEGVYKEKTMKSYAVGVARAWFHNVEWHTKLDQNPDMKLPWTKAAPKKSKHGGEAKVASKAVVLKATDIKTAAKEFAALLRKFGMKDFATDFELDVADRLS